MWIGRRRAWPAAYGNEIGIVQGEKWMSAVSLLLDAFRTKFVHDSRRYVEAGSSPTGRSAMYDRLRGRLGALANEHTPASRVARPSHRAHGGASAQLVECYRRPPLASTPTQLPPFFVWSAQSKAESHVVRTISSPSRKRGGAVGARLNCRAPSATAYSSAIINTPGLTEFGLVIVSIIQSVSMFRDDYEEVEDEQGKARRDSEPECQGRTGTQFFRLGVEGRFWPGFSWANDVTPCESPISVEFCRPSRVARSQNGDDGGRQVFCLAATCLPATSCRE
ncbi:hypothetical protein C8R46DRAFT_1026803 [Mycena filopes]|nr:hypothetical protein C8R46DRAFT_1026803 [Mycena filopes]